MIGLWVCVISGLVLGGCKGPVVEKDYGRPLPPGAFALRKITVPSQLPDLKIAWTNSDGDLLSALDRSLDWFTKPSTQRFFPMAGISHGHARVSVFAFRQLLETSTSESQFEQRVLEQFDVYTSVGWDGRGTVLFTGYYSPVFNASWELTHEYRYPLYHRPTDLVTEPVTGEVLGRRVGQAIVTYPTRRQIESSNMLAGRELVYLKNKLDAYLIQVNGSAKLIMTDGSVRYFGYAGNNGHDYTSLAGLLVADGKLDPNRVSLPAIRDYFRRQPGELDHYMLQNDRFVFFQEYDGGSWPAGSLGVPVTAERTLATDKDVFPRGCVTLVQTRVPTSGPIARRFEQFMLDQDTGGAIRAAGRADIYMGIGPQAETLAGRTVAEGRLYYFFLKPARLAAWRTQMESKISRR
ncbi:MAG: MltA domain-containing protein [Phycisphaeraceae bacterium]